MFSVGLETTNTADPKRGVAKLSARSWNLTADMLGQTATVMQLKCSSDDVTCRVLKQQTEVSCRNQ